MKYLFLLALAAFTFASCGKDGAKPEDKQECGDERTAGMTITSSADWDFWHSTAAGASKYSTFYDNTTGPADFILEIFYENACPFSPTDVGMSFTTKKEIPNLEVIVAASEYGIGKAVNLPVTKMSPTLYNCYEAYVYPDSDDKNPTIFRAEAVVRFPTKGSWHADSTYFFGEVLQSFGLTVHAKIPK